MIKEVTESKAPPKISIFFVKSALISQVCIAETRKRFANEPNVEINTDYDLEWVKKKVSEGAQGIVIFAIDGRAELAEYIMFLQTIKPPLDSSGIINCVFSKELPRKVEESLIKAGCEEIFPFNLQPKALVYKISRYLKLLETREIPEEQEKKLISGHGNPLPKPVPPPEKSEIVLLNPLESKYDFWLLGNIRHAKKSRHFYFIEMIGPSATAGYWSPIQLKNPELRFEQAWKWVERKRFPHFGTDDHTWIFNGKKPVYSWFVNRWAFASTRPELTLFKGENAVCSRYKLAWLEDLKIARNALNAEEIFEKIKETYVQDRRFEFEESTTVEGKFNDDHVAVPWSDEINSELLPKGWTNTPVDSEDNSNVWNNLLGQKLLEQSNSETEEEQDHRNRPRQLRILLGVDAMKECGIRGSLKDRRIEIVGYTDDGYIIVGLATGLVSPNENVEIKIKEENIGNNRNLRVYGIIKGIIETGDERALAKIMLADQSAQFGAEIENLTVEKQTDLTAFFTRSKGISAEFSTPSLEEEELVKKYLSNQRILILDATSSSRLNLAGNLQRMGAIRSKITLAGSMQEARDAMRKEVHRVILSEYYIGKSSGFDFIQEQRAVFERKGIADGLFILITANATQSAAAHAAEEDIDQFIIKPYSFNSARNLIGEAIRNKITPSPYSQMIAKAKDFIAKEDWAAAEKVLTQALKEPTNLALAHYYFGKLKNATGNLKEAEEYFNDGLDQSKIHYNCLNGLHELLWSQKRYQEAYDTVKKIVHYFPANSKRLSNTLRDAIITDSFHDMEGYFHIFEELEVKSEEVIQYICSGLVVTGKYYLRKKVKDRALEFFEHARLTAGARTKFVLYIIEALIDQKLIDECARFVHHLQNIAPNSTDESAAQFLLASISIPAVKAIPMGRKVIENGIAIQSVFDQLIRLCVEEDQTEYAHELCQKAAQQWPAKKTYFEALVASN